MLFSAICGCKTTPRGLSADFTWFSQGSLQIWWSPVHFTAVFSVEDRCSKAAISLNNLNNCLCSLYCIHFYFFLVLEGDLIKINKKKLMAMSVECNLYYKSDFYESCVCVTWVSQSSLMWKFRALVGEWSVNWTDSGLDQEVIQRFTTRGK